MRRALSLLLCLLLFFTVLPEPAQADTQEITVLCRTPESPTGLICPVLIHQDQVYLNARSAAHLTGYRLISESGSAQFELGSLKTSYTGSCLSFSGQKWYPIEGLMDSLHTRVVTAGGELIFNPVSEALSVLNESIDERWRMRVGIDPDDSTIQFGLNLAKAFNIISEAAIADLFDNSYDRHIYHSAISNLMTRSVDSDSAGFSDLVIDFENRVIDPLSVISVAADCFFSEEVMQAFYAGSELKDIYEWVDAYDTVAGSMDYAELLEMAETIHFYGSAIGSGETGLTYLLDCSPMNDDEELLLDTIRQSLGVYRGFTDEAMSFLGDLYWEFGTNIGHSLLQEAMLSEAGSLVVKLTSEGLKKLIPGVDAMDELEKCAAFYRLQQLADEQINRAIRQNDYHRLKYALILYYRCAYLYTQEALNMNIRELEEPLKQQQNTLNEIESKLLSLPDSAVSLLMTSNSRIYPRALLGPSASHAEFFNSLTAQYGELNVKNYFGTDYLEEGSGIIAPWLHCIGEDSVLTVLRQEGSNLIQMVYLDAGSSGNPVLIDERVVLTCGSNGSLYYGFNDESGALLSCTSYDLNLSSYSFTDSLVECRLHQADLSLDSLSASRKSAWQNLYQMFGEYEPAFTVDGSDGLFKISHSPAELRSVFLQKFNRPD